MIPKKIHYCWFGRGKKDKLFYKCLESWKKFFPDYEIIEWNEDNFDVNYNTYTKEAYENKKYAFVSDVARLKILYDQGGIYFDTDVEVIKKFPEEVLERGYFAEEIRHDDLVNINTGLGFSVPAKNKAIKIMLDDYDKVHFVNRDGNFDLTPCLVRNSRALIDAGYSIEPGQEVAGIPIYDNRYFCGYDFMNHQYDISDETLSIHHYAASWQSTGLKRISKFKEKVSNIVGIENYNKIRDFKNNFKKKPIKELKKHTDILFFVGYFFILANFALSAVSFVKPALPYFDYIGIACIGLFALINIKRYRIRDYIIVTIFAVLFAIVALKSHDKTPLKLLAIITAFKGVDFKKFVKNDFKVRLFFFLTVIFLSFLGLTQTGTYHRGEEIRHSFGVGHPNQFGFYSIVLSAELVYLMRNRIVPIIFIGILLAVNYFLVDSRAATIVLALLLVYVLLPYCWSRKILRFIPVKLILTCSFLIFLVFSVFMTFNWTAARQDWIFKVNKAFNNRFYFSKVVANEYSPTTLFGNYFEKREDLKGAPKNTPMTVDNAYMYSVIILGLVTTTILALAYTRTFRQLYKTNNYTMVVILSLVCLYAVSEPIVTDVGINPFVILLGSALFGSWNDLERGDAAKLMRHSRRNRQKVLLVSQVNTNNYGSLLQIFCLERALETFLTNNPKPTKLTKVKVLDYDIIENAAKRLKRKKTKFSSYDFKLKFAKVMLWPFLRIRNGRLNGFRRRKMGLYPIDPIRMQDDLRYVDKFGVYMVGSDQIWSSKGLDKVNTLSWVSSSSLKVSYATQIGDGSLESGDFKRYYALEDFRALSAETYTYANTQIGHVFNKEFREVASPIVLLGREALLRYCRKSNNKRKCLCYFSGGSDLHRRYALKYTEYNKLKMKAVVGMNDDNLAINRSLFSRAIWRMDPIRLIKKVNQSSLVITDSYDVLVLSVLLHKNFIVLCRENINDLENYKMVAFLDKIGLKHLFNKAPVENRKVKITKAKWKEVDKTIEQMRSESLNYLQDVLKLDKRNQENAMRARKS